MGGGGGTGGGKSGWRGRAGRNVLVCSRRVSVEKWVRKESVCGGACAGEGRARVSSEGGMWGRGDLVGGGGGGGGRVCLPTQSWGQKNFLGEKVPATKGVPTNSG